MTAVSFGAQYLLGRKAFMEERLFLPEFFLLFCFALALVQITFGHAHAHLEIVLLTVRET